MIQKHQFKQVAAFAGLYFLAIGLGVLLGSLVDNRGNMFYAPAFSALVGGGTRESRIQIERNPLVQPGEGYRNIIDYYLDDGLMDNKGRIGKES